MKMRVLAGVVAMSLAVGNALNAQVPANIDVKGNLALIPAQDPPPAGEPPKILPALAQQHPRLMFSTSEIAALKAACESDPILKRTLADVGGWARRFKVPDENPPKIVTNDTSALAVACERYVGLAYAYALEKDPNAKRAIIDLLTMMLNEPHWAINTELDSNMGAGNNMLMVGMLFDVVADELEPAFRKQMAEKMLTHVRRMHYLGHLQKGLKSIKYWQQDPQNNHRWHRMAGVSACLLAIADEPGIEAGYLLDFYKKELDFLTRWFPKDGDCHEGAGYQKFGFMYLAMSAMMWDRVTGSDYLKTTPGFANAAHQQIYYKAPGRTGNQSFGDDSNGDNGHYNHHSAAFFLSPRLSRDANLQAALIRHLETFMERKDGKPTQYPWGLLAFYDPTLKPGDADALPTQHLFADLGAASIRDKWSDDAVLFTFKCGPYGGYRLNEYRHTVLDASGKPHYINLAHDDPDANSFAMGTSGEFLFHPGLYSQKKSTETHSTITVDGKGQLGEGKDYTQPVPGVDMRTLSYLTGWKADPSGRVIVEGEAGAAYPALERFRRTAVYLPGEYILVLDDIRGKGSHEITWRGTVEGGQIKDASLGQATVETPGGLRMDLQIMADQPVEAAVSPLEMPARFGSKKAQQLQFSASADAVRFACVMDPWKTQPVLTRTDDGETVTLTVQRGDQIDTWTWKPAADSRTPSPLSGTRNGQPLVALTADDKAPHGD